MDFHQRLIVLELVDLAVVRAPRISQREQMLRNTRVEEETNAEINAYRWCQ